MVPKQVRSSESIGSSLDSLCSKSNHNSANENEKCHVNDRGHIVNLNFKQEKECVKQLKIPSSQLSRMDMGSHSSFVLYSLNFRQHRRFTPS